MNTKINNSELAKTTGIALVVALIINIALATMAQPLAPNLMQLTAIPVAIWTILGIVGSTLVFRYMLRNPENIVARFKKTVWIVLLISFIPDILIYFVEIPGFTGATVGGVLALMALHVTTAAVSLHFLLKKYTK